MYQSPGAHTEGARTPLCSDWKLWAWGERRPKRRWPIKPPVAARGQPITDLSSPDHVATPATLHPHNLRISELFSRKTQKEHWIQPVTVHYPKYLLSSSFLLPFTLPRSTYWPFCSFYYCLQEPHRMLVSVCFRTPRLSLGHPGSLKSVHDLKCMRTQTRPRFYVSSERRAPL